MRRFAATLLLSVFSVSLIAAALPADSESKLPACCRREGAHHCMTAPAPGASMQAVCPAYPETGATPAHARMAGLRPAPIVVARIPVDAAAPVAIRTFARSACVGTSQNRAPPSLFS